MHLPESGGERVGSFTWDSLEQERPFQQLSSSESLPRADKDGGRRLLLPPQPTCCQSPPKEALCPPLPPAASGGRHPPSLHSSDSLLICLHVVGSPLTPLEVLLKSLPQTREPTCQTDLPLPQPAGTFLQN